MNLEIGKVYKFVTTRPLFREKQVCRKILSSKITLLFTKYTICRTTLVSYHIFRLQLCDVVLLLIEEVFHFLFVHFDLHHMPLFTFFKFSVLHSYFSSTKNKLNLEELCLKLKIRL